MSILSSLERRQALGLTDEKAWDQTLWNLAGSQSISGEIVTERTALYYSPVFNAVSLIAGTVGSLPLHLMQEKDKRKRIAANHKAYRVMHYEWNPYLTAMAGRECLMSHVLLWGNGFAEITRNVMGDIVELWPITPDRVRLKKEGSQIVYVVRVDGRDVVIPREYMLHVPGLGFDGFIGYSVVAMARKSLGLSMALETFGAMYFGNGTHPGTIVSHPGKLSGPAHDSL